MLAENFPVPVGRATSPPNAPPLRLLFWESTAACNLACIHCRRLDVSRALSKSDMSTAQSLDMIRSLPALGRPILVFSGGEPLMRPDIWELAAEARAVKIPIALATNGTPVTDQVAKQIVDSGFQRVSISFDGPDAPTHDQFRGHGAFDATIAGFKALRSRGMSMQINTTIARHNFQNLDETYRLALELDADALHCFMLVPVGCGMSLSEDVMLRPDEYERALNWIYDRSLEGKVHLKATCAPHYFRVMRQRAKTAGGTMPRNSGQVTKWPSDQVTGAHPHSAGSHPHSATGPLGHSATSHSEMAAMTKGCLAGQAICFVSHTGEVFPCGYLPVTSGNVKTIPLPDIWRDSRIFADFRDDSRLEGKCGVCEFKKVCMGCRARAYSATSDYLAEEPNCSYTPVRLQVSAGKRPAVSNGASN